LTISSLRQHVMSRNKRVPWVKDNKNTPSEVKTIICNMVGFEVPFSVQFISLQMYYSLSLKKWTSSQQYFSTTFHFKGYQNGHCNTPPEVHGTESKRHICETKFRYPSEPFNISKKYKHKMFLKKFENARVANRIRCKRSYHGFHSKRNIRTRTDKSLPFLKKKWYFSKFPYIYSMASCQAFPNPLNWKNPGVNRLL